jgi:energy-coupling factor transporter transmembrane protein EcfT
VHDVCFDQLRRSLKMRYQMIDASNYRGFKRIKHLLIPVLSQNIRRAHQLSVAMESKGFKEIHDNWKHQSFGNAFLKNVLIG